MASPDPQFHPFLVLRQHGHRNRLHPAVQLALPIPRVEGYRGGDLLLERIVVRGLLRDLLVSNRRVTLLLFDLTSLNTPIPCTDSLIRLTPSNPQPHSLKI